MPTEREEELRGRNNNELRELLEEYEQPVTGNKDELVARIVHFEAGVPEPEDEADDEEVAAPEADANDAPPEASDDDDEDEPVEDESGPTDEAAKAEGDNLTLVKYTGRSPSFQRGSYTFSAQHPFIAVPNDVCSRLVEREPRRFRTATQAEVEKYYN